MVTSIEKNASQVPGSSSEKSKDAIPGEDSLGANKNTVVSLEEKIKELDKGFEDLDKSLEEAGATIKKLTSESSKPELKKSPEIPKGATPPPVKTEQQPVVTSEQSAKPILPSPRQSFEKSPTPKIPEKIPVNPVIGETRNPESSQKLPPQKDITQPKSVPASGATKVPAVSPGEQKGSQEPPEKQNVASESTSVPTKNLYPSTPSKIYPEVGKYYGPKDSGGNESGKGKFVWSNNATYEGLWHNGEMHGKGVMTLADGSKKEGEFRNGRFWNGNLIDQQGVVNRCQDGIQLANPKKVEDVTMGLLSMDTRGTPLEKFSEELKNPNLSHDRLVGIQDMMVNQMTRNKIGATAIEFKDEKQFQDFLQTRKDIRASLGLPALPEVKIEDLQHKPKTYEEWKARNEFLAQNTDFGKIKGALADGYSFLSDQVQNKLNKVQDKTIFQGGTQIRSYKENGQNMIDIGGVRWNINETPWSYDKKTPTTPPHYAGELLLHRKLENGDIVSGVIPSKEAFSQDGKWNVSALQGAVKYADKLHASEQADKARIGEFDFPKDKPIGYVGINSPDDLATSGSVGGWSKYFPRFMREQGYNIKTLSGGSSFDRFNRYNTVESTLRRTIEEYQKNGIDNVFLNLNGHGDRREGLFFNSKDWQAPASRLTKAQFANIIRDYPQMKFGIDTIACQNGGLADVMAGLSIKDADRVTAFLGADKWTNNQGGYSNDDDLRYTKPGISSGTDGHSVDTPYNLYLSYFLSQGLSYGQAHLRADKKAQQINFPNPQVWRGNKQTASYKISEEEPMV